MDTLTNVILWLLIGMAYFGFMYVGTAAYVRRVNRKFYGSARASSPELKKPNQRNCSKSRSSRLARGGCLQFDTGESLEVIGRRHFVINVGEDGLKCLPPLEEKEPRRK